MGGLSSAKCQNKLFCGLNNLFILLCSAFWLAFFYANCKGDEAVSGINSPDEFICSPVNDIFWNI